MHLNSYVTFLGAAAVLSACTEPGSHDERLFRSAAIDSDGDGIPDEDDPFPLTATFPGTAAFGTVYAHTSSTLYTVQGTAPYAVAEVGPFTFPDQGSSEITDIAIDRWGVLYAVSFNALFACNPATAECYALTQVDEASNGLAVLPVGTLSPDDDTIVASGISGTWSELTLNAGTWTQTILGGYGSPYGSSGDVSPLGSATLAAASVDGQAEDVLVSIDPTTGAVIGEVLAFTGHSTVYGLAELETQLLGFDANGDILLIDPAAATVEVVSTTPHVWYGAASRPAAVPPPVEACLVATGDIVLADRSSVLGANVLAGDNIEVGVCGIIEGSVAANGDAFLRGQPGCPVQIDGDLTLAGTLTSQGGHEVIGGTLTTGASVTPPTIETQSVSVGTQAERGCTRALSPGDYDVIETYGGCTLTLSSGVYNASAFRLYAGASLTVDLSSGPVEINVEGDFAWHDRVSVQHAGGSALSPDDLLIYTHQSNPVRMGTDTTFVGRISAPFAAFTLSGRSSYLGCVEAVDIHFEPDASLIGS